MCTHRNEIVPRPGGNICSLRKDKQVKCCENM